MKNRELLLATKNLLPSTRILVHYLVEYSEGDPFKLDTESINNIAEESGLAVSTIRKGIKSLIDINVLRKIDELNKIYTFSKEYIINESSEVIVTEVEVIKEVVVKEFIEVESKVKPILISIRNEGKVRV